MVSGSITILKNAMESSHNTIMSQMQTLTRGSTDVNEREPEIEDINTNEIAAIKSMLPLKSKEEIASFEDNLKDDIFKSNAVSSIRGCTILSSSSCLQNCFLKFLKGLQLILFVFPSHLFG